VKVLDVASLEAGIEKTIADIERKRTQIEAIQRAVRDLHSLEDALAGQGGDAIRRFYKNTHEPFLIFLHQSLTDYELALEKISEAVNSVESDSNGYISQFFLEGEVTEAFEKVGLEAKEFADDANEILNNVSDLVTTTEIDESEVMDNVRKGKEKATDLVEELVELDDFGTAQLESTQDNLQTMKGFLSEIESGFVDGTSISSFEIASVRKGQGFQDIMKSIYGEHGEFAIILRKYRNGEPITAVEREDLYEYIQTELLNKEKRKEIEEVASFIDEDNIDHLTEHLNDKVVTSDLALEEEIMMVESYLNIGTNTPTESGVEYETRHKLRTYLMLLKGYDAHVQENNSVILVDDLTYTNNKHNVAYLESTFSQSSYEGKGNVTRLPEDGPVEEYYIKDKDDYRDWFFFSSGYLTFESDQESIKVTDAQGSNAATNIRKTDLEELKDQRVNFTTNFFKKELFKQVGGAVLSTSKKGNIVGSVVEVGRIGVEYTEEKEELDGEIELEDHLVTASDLNLSVTMREDSFAEDITMDLSPTDGTFIKLERLLELHEIDSRITFPQTAINEQNWEKVREDLEKSGSTFGEQVNDFINGSTPKSAEEIIDELK